MSCFPQLNTFNLTQCFWGFETNLRNIPLSTWLSGSVYRDTSGGRGREGTGLSIVYIIIDTWGHSTIRGLDHFWQLLPLYTIYWFQSTVLKQMFLRQNIRPNLWLYLRPEGFCHKKSDLRLLPDLWYSAIIRSLSRTFGHLAKYSAKFDLFLMCKS